MPLYEYGCDACGHTLEIQQKLAEAPLKTCPSCGKDALQKLISATAFVLKGGGWYKDGYGSQKPGDTSSSRTENQRTDRLEKAIGDDKKKTEAAATSSDASSSSSSSSSSGSGASSASSSTPAATPSSTKSDAG